MLHYMLKKTEQTMKLMEESKNIPTCILIKQKQRRVKITSYKLFMFNMELLGETLRFASQQS